MDSNLFALAGFSDEKRALLASLLQQSDVEPQAAGIARRSDSNYYPLSAGQRRLWFLDRLEGGSHYNENLSVRIHGGFDLRLLTGVLREILRRHEAMRASFALLDGEPVQRIVSPRAMEPEIVDLRGIPEAQREIEAVRLAVETARQPFHLGEGPLWRFTVLRMGDRDHIVLVIAHHIAVDGWSMGVFWKEFGTLYNAFKSGQPSPLPEPPIQYADYAAWQSK